MILKSIFNEIEETLTARREERDPFLLSGLYEMIGKSVMCPGRMKQKYFPCQNRRIVVLLDSVDSL